MTLERKIIAIQKKCVILTEKVKIHTSNLKAKYIF